MLRRPMRLQHLTALLFAAALAAQTWPGPQPDGRILLPSGWWLAPFGEHVDLPSDLPVRLCVHQDQRFVAVQHCGYRQHLVVILDSKTKQVVAQHKLLRSWSGMCWSGDGKRLFVSGGVADGVSVFPFDAATGALGKPEVWATDTGKALDLPAGLCSAADGTLWVCLQRSHQLLQLAADGKELRRVALPKQSYPFEPALGADGSVVFVSLWNRAEVVAIDVATGQTKAAYATGQHPSELLLHPDGTRLFVSNGNENSVSVVDLGQGRVTETITSSLFPNSPPGSTPNSLAIVGDKLLIANADNNDLAVVEIETPGHSVAQGFIPTGQYPTSVRVLKDGTVLVANGKGSLGSHANPDGPSPLKGAKDVTQYSGGMFGSTLSWFLLPKAAELAVQTGKALRCAPLRADASTRGVRPVDSPIPAVPGGASPIRYVLYVIKENRTYDQVFGDLPQGNGDANLCLFPREVTPNHHAIAEQFVLLDNFYVESEVSADGHEWSMGAYASDFVERSWPVSYGGKGGHRTPEGASVELGYPSEGHFALATPQNGYLWDLAAAAGISYRSYGEFVSNPTAKAGMKARSKALEGHFCPDYRSFEMSYPDCQRVEVFVQELQQFEQQGEMPRLCIVRLPQDHTSGTAEGAFTPQSCVADNDLALGRLLAALSHSRFWAQMAVFVVEDDAQNGPDHVDAHRTVGLVAGPFVARGKVVSTMYSTCSMLRTMELILGLVPMSQFDAAALPMYDCFTGTADLRPYVALQNRVAIDARNHKDAPGAKKSAMMDFSREDAAPDLLLSEVVWQSVKGPGVPMPAPVRAAFVRPLGGDDDR